MATQIQKKVRAVHDSFSATLDAKFKERFRRNLTTEWNFIIMRRVSRPTNGKPFTPKQKAWVEGFSAGYREVMSMLEAK